MGIEILWILQIPTSLLGSWVGISMNLILSNSNKDKFGGRPVCTSRATKFTERLDHCGMVDLGFPGSPLYSYILGLIPTLLVGSSLDRFWPNSSWRNLLLYPDAHVSPSPSYSIRPLLYSPHHLP